MDSDEVAEVKFDTILNVDDVRLHKVCEPADDDWIQSGEIFVLIAMMKAHLAANGGIGLAANQVGCNRRVIVVTNGPETFILVNPVIQMRSGKVRVDEGCLSVDGGTSRYLCKRSKTIRVSYTQPEQTGKNSVEFIPQTTTLKGLAAVVVQHEIDHLNGINITQHGKRISENRELKTA